MLISISPSAFPAASSARRLRLAALMIGFAVLAFCIMWWRWYRALADWRAIASLAGCAGLVLPLALAGLRRAPHRLQSLKGLLLLMALPALYAALCVRVDGRAIWGLYPMLIPFAVSIGTGLRQHPDAAAQGGV